MQKHELVDNIAFGSSPCIILTLTLNKPRIAGFIQVKSYYIAKPPQSEIFTSKELHIYK